MEETCSSLDGENEGVQD